MKIERRLWRRALLEMAEASPLNDSQEGPAWEGVLQPRLGRPAKL